MRIAFIFDGLDIGGIERVGIQYVRLLKEMGHEIDVYNLDPDRSELHEELIGLCTPFESKLPKCLIPESYILVLKRWWWGKYLYPFLYLLSKLTLLLLLPFKRSHQKYDVAIAFAGHFNDLAFIKYGFIKYDKACCWLHGALIDYLVLAYTFGDFYKDIKNLVVLSENGQCSALNACAYLKSELNIVKIANPVDLSSKMPDEQTCNELTERFGNYLLMVGRLANDKDQKTLIEARRILENQYGLTPHVVFVGDGERREELESHAKSLGLENSIHFEGPRTDVENYYSTAHVYVHSSPAEGLPTAIIEALGFSLPVVSTDSPPGVTEILRDDEFGLRCDVADPNDMAAKIAQMLTDESLRTKYSSKAQLRANDFSLDRATSSLNSLLEDLV